MSAIGYKGVTASDSVLSKVPNGTTQYYFEGGLPGISSLSLTMFINEIYGEEGVKTTVLHKSLCRTVMSILVELRSDTSVCRRNTKGVSNVYQEVMSNIVVGVKGDVEKKINIVTDRSRYDNYRSCEGEYIDNLNRVQKHYWLSNDVVSNIASKYSSIIRRRIISELNFLTAIIRSITDVSVVNPSIESLMDGTAENLERDRGLVSILAAKHMGYYPLSVVKQLCKEQTNLSFDKFSIKHPWKATALNLYHISRAFAKHIHKTSSHIGKGTANLYHHTVLEEYFTDIDLSSLRDPEDT